ncbi:putative lipid-transfer protein DIR1 [Tasmannia lanceolata]|uniref:putative lipid-transfer protein DIR1 n=1 Tax=Tasmannia lanceolata TaxID=3420 RepID=UPI004063DD13
MEMNLRLALVAIVLALVLGTQHVQCKAEPILCNISQDGFMACKPSVTGPNPADPSAACCSALSAANLTCLCSYKNSMVLPALGIDPDLCMQLPSKCKLSSPAQC